MSVDDVVKRIAEIEARVERATAGPWSVAGLMRTLLEAKVRSPLAPDQAKHDADFIAYARADVPWLTEQWRSLRRENEELRAAVKAATSSRSVP